MVRLPAISGLELIRILERKGYRRVRTKGSHARLYPPDFLPGAKKVTVPLHKHIKVGTLSSIMEDAGLAADDLQ